MTKLENQSMHNLKNLSESDFQIQKFVSQFEGFKEIKPTPKSLLISEIFRKSRNL